ncbi:hypothetical protein DFQ26_005422 [Actinomortierella ambigua]|nr:hypothetical protein DFQ26_005422 [Actinomortierella ambigua]
MSLADFMLTWPHPSSTRQPSFPGPVVLLLLLVALNAISPSSFPPPCSASRKGGEDQRVDTPSLDDTTYLMVGQEYGFTNKTPVVNSPGPREYVDGVLATQKVIAAPIIPINRQLWPGVDATRSYFGRGKGTNTGKDPIDYGKQRMEAIPNVLRAGMRKLVLDLWWDPVALGWQICPRINRDARTPHALAVALAMQQRLGAEENTSKNANGAAPLLQPLESQSSPQHYREGQSEAQPTDALNAPEVEAEESRSKVAGAGTSRMDSIKGVPEEAPVDNLSQQPRLAHRRFLSSLSSLFKRAADKVGLSEAKAEDDAKRGLRNPRPLQPRIGRRHDQDTPSATSTAPSETSNSASFRDLSGQTARHRLHTPERLAMGRSRVSTYDSSLDTDKTVDGITCSTGQDLAIVLQALQSWLLQTSDDELVDILLVIINLNELSTGSTRPETLIPQPTASQSSSPSATGPTLTPPEPSTSGGTLVGDNFSSVPVPDLSSVISPNTNATIMAVLPNMISLRHTLEDAFPHAIYSPVQLQLDRSNLNVSWWKEGPVGLDYYNTTMDPDSHIVTTSTGWPTSKYLTDVLKTRVVVGFGNVNLSSNSTYNITDDLGLIFAPGLLEGMQPSSEGSRPTSGNSSASGLLKFSPSLDSNHCSRPMPGVLMKPTGAEGNWTQLAEDEHDANVQYRLRWGFANLADSSDTPWTYEGIKTATACGFSMLDQAGGSGLTFSDQVASTSWSWDIDQPPSNEITSRNKRCGVMTSNGRWAVQNCNLKLPVACRKIGTSGQWLVHKGGAANYRDVVCPDGYKFDVPRTARENQELYKTLLQLWNDTAPAFFSAVMRQQNLQQEMLKVKLAGTAGLQTEARSPSDSTSLAARNLGRRKDDGGSSEENEHRHHDQTHETENNQDRLIALAGSGNLLPDGTSGMIWIDISSWQTAGCWVPGGTEGLCPYRSPDHTAAMQEIIKVSSIGGVIMLILAGAFLYTKCRRNIRLRKASRRRSAVRTKILRTEIETVPA